MSTNIDNIKDICTHDTGEPIFSYMLITDKQNNYMHQFKRVFRFLGYTQAEVEQYLSKEEITLSGDYLVTVGDRGEQLDVSPLELHFEKSFSNTYGKQWKKRVGYQVLYKMNL